jgi:hypothetical protein
MKHPANRNHGRCPQNNEVQKHRLEISAWFFEFANLDLKNLEAKAEKMG